MFNPPSPADLFKGDSSFRLATVGNSVVSLPCDGVTHYQDELSRWPLDDASGDIVDDEGYLQNNGRLVNGPTWVLGKIGTALRFDQVCGRKVMGWQIVQCVCNRWLPSRHSLPCFAPH